MNISVVSFWDIILSFKIKMFSLIIKKVKVKVLDEKIIIVSVDREFFGWLFIVVNVR